MNPADFEQQYGFNPLQQGGNVPDFYQMIMDLGIPACVIIAAFWFIRYQSEQAKAEREEFWKKDEEHDARLLDMIEKSSDAHLQVKIAIEQMTQAVKEYANWKK